MIPGYPYLNSSVLIWVGDAQKSKSFRLQCLHRVGIFRRNLVVVPGEAAVTAFAALSVSTGEPGLGAVIVVATVAAVLGDAACYLVGRTIGLERWRWMRTRRVRAALAWARARLEQRAALVLFTARFVPFARLAVNLTAGATKVGAPRYRAMWPPAKPEPRRTTAMHGLSALPVT